METAKLDINMYHNLNGSLRDQSNFSKTDSQSKNPNNSRSQVRPKVAIDWECVNSECSIIGSNLKQSENHETSQVKTASKYVIGFYGQTSKDDHRNDKTNKIRKKRKVCLPCEKKAIDAQDAMLTKLAANQSVITEKLFPTCKDVVVIEDSDEEPITDTSSDSEIEIEFEKESTELSSEQDVEMKLEMEISAVLNKYNIEQQTKDTVEIINHRLDNLQTDYNETDEVLKNIEKEVDRIRATFYKPFRPVPKFLEPLDLNLAETSSLRERELLLKTNSATSESSIREIVHHSSTANHSTLQNVAGLPPPGKLERPELVTNEKVYAVRGNILNVWKVASVVDLVPGADKKYRLRFESSKDGNIVSSYFKIVSAKHLAYNYPASVRLSVGTRIIAIYNENQPDDRSQSPQLPGEYYSGIIAEPPKAMNKHRYLVFFDDGYASYIKHQDIRVVCRQTDSNGNISGVWDDIHPNSKEFIKKYLIQYPERPMVRLMQNQTVRTEWEGSWWYTKVEAVDASLVKLIFHVNGRRESVYRGSTRLEPLYLEMQQQKKRAEQIILNQQAATEAQGGKTQNINKFMPRNRIEGYKKNRPYVEYTRQPDLDSPSNEDQPVRRAVAKKSTGSKRSPPQITESLTDKPAWDKRGTVGPTELDRFEGVPFVKHQCGSNCIQNPHYQYKENQMRGTNPLLIPIALGWKREICRFRNYGRRSVYYIAPCGRRLRNMDEVHRYLIETNSLLEMDFFNFDWSVKVYNEFKPEREYIRIQDISYGKENFAVSCVNSLDKNYPEYVEYSRIRIPQSNVKINTDSNFMVCCDCKDDCHDKAKCACWQLSIQHTEAAPGMKGRTDSDIGYVYRRLLDNVPTGIFECNSGCKCKSSCLNRVAQNPLRVRLQVFKTERRGWGIRALNDIPAGGFICIYVGNLYSNDEANRQGQDFGDEYFAELDMIESVEGRKEGYESDVDEEFLNESVERDTSVSDEESSKDGDFSIPSYASQGIEKASKERPKREHRDINPVQADEQAKEEKIKHVSTRKLIGPKEDVYIMDAKSIGNIGRYLNHSCNPNVFVQNCFVDTHDLRFPWVAFFASVHIPAGEELCWDYQYIVDQVKGKEIYCQCNSDNCRGRLL